MYIHTHPPIKSGAEETTKVILTEFPGNSFILCYCSTDSRKVPPTPSNSGYIAIPFLRAFTFIFFTPEYGRCVYNNIHFSRIQFSRTLDAKTEAPPVILPPRSFQHHDFFSFAVQYPLNKLCFFFFPPPAGKKKPGYTNTV